VRAHGGLVRCGACRGVFDARAHLVEGTLDVEQEDADTFGAPQTIIAGIPPVSHAPTVDEVRRAAREAIEQAAPSKQAPTADENRLADYDWRAPSEPLTHGQKIGFGALVLTSLLVLIAQSLYWFRDEIASRAPSLAPHLAAACTQLGCRVSPPKRAELLGFVGADLAADPAHKGLHVFTATLRNTSARSVAYPSLVLTLDGVGGQTIARRVFAPEQYAPANANLARGLEGGGELEIKLYLDVSPAVPVGFKADHAYF
jgi:Protein of unknown function (DUF3426)